MYIKVQIIYYFQELKHTFFLDLTVILKKIEITYVKKCYETFIINTEYFCGQSENIEGFQI